MWHWSFVTHDQDHDRWMQVQTGSFPSVQSHAPTCGYASSLNVPGSDLELSELGLIEVVLLRGLCLGLAALKRTTRVQKQGQRFSRFFDRLQCLHI